MGLIEKYYVVTADGHEPLYLKGYIYKNLCFQSNIHPNYYEDIPFDKVKDYLREHFNLVITIHNCDNKFCVHLKQINKNDSCQWIWGMTFDNEQDAWEYAYDKTLKVINEYKIEYIENIE